MQEGNAGMWSGYVRNHLLPRLFGFELLMAPYAVAHLKLGLQLAGPATCPRPSAATGPTTSPRDERLGVYLTNTLEEAAQAEPKRSSVRMRVITEEANAAALRQARPADHGRPGQPALLGHRHAVREQAATGSGSRETFIGGLLKDYY